MFEIRSESERHAIAQEIQRPYIADNKKYFFNSKTLRLTETGFKFFSNQKKFNQIKIQVDSFKMLDLVKISKLNNDLFYIDTKNHFVYSYDQEFSNWVNLIDGNIVAIRNLK